MQSDTLKIIYYAFFHSVIIYGNIAWGGAFRNNLKLLQQIQNRILKIVNKNCFNQHNSLNLKQIFAYEYVSYHYNEQKKLYLTSTSLTINKLIIPPGCEKAVSDRSNYLRAI